MSEELKPCPFCGGTDIGLSYIETYSTDSSYDVFGCRGCGARFEDGNAADWNTRAELSRIKAGQGEAVAYRYKEGHASWENENPWVPTTLAHGAVLLERKELAANGAFKGDERDHYLALAVEPLYLAPPSDPGTVRVEQERDAALKQVEGLRALATECANYLSINEMTCICSGSVLHRKLADAALQAKP